MSMPHWLIAAAAIAAQSALADTIVIEPDAYAPGTNLSSISAFVSISTTAGGNVYAANIGSGAANGSGTGPLGQRAFSTAAGGNSEWMYGELSSGPNYYDAGSQSWRFPELPEDGGGFMLRFNQPVTSFSLLFAELFPDAGCCSDDPIAMYIFDGDDNLVQQLWADGSPGGYLGNGDDPEDAWPYWAFTYSGSSIGRVIVAGESEPTTIDRLSFTTASVEAPLPAAAWLFGSALGLLALRRLR